MTLLEPGLSEQWDHLVELSYGYIIKCPLSIYCRGSKKSVEVITANADGRILILMD